MKHSILAPSKAFRLDKCAASPLMEAATPELTADENLAAREGTAAHYIGEQILKSYQSNDGPILSLDQLPETDPDGEPLTETMLESAQVYTSHVLNLCHQYGGLSNLTIEQPVNIERVHSECFGTPDSFIYQQTDQGINDQLHIVDFKHGFRPVEAEENLQLIEYATGIIDTLGLDDLTTTVHLTIVQPRVHHVLGPVRTWTIPASDMRPYINHLRDQAELALSGSAPAVSGSHCLNCSARRSCNTAKNAAYNAIEAFEQGVPFNMPDDQIGLEIITLRRYVEAIKARLEGLESDAQTRIESGKQIDGLSMGAGRGSVSWKEGQEQLVIEIGKLFKVDLAKPIQPITPKQCEKLAIDMSILDPYIVRKSGAPKLIKTEDTLAYRVFKPKR